MTNYNERLAEQLNYLMEYSYKYGQGVIPSSEDPPLIVARQAKQALISLLKELVAEAKPGTWVDPEDTDDLEWQGYVNGVEHFEQNLLKALEEVE